MDWKSAATIGRSASAIRRRARALFPAPAGPLRSRDGTGRPYAANLTRWKFDVRGIPKFQRYESVSETSPLLAPL